MLIWHCGILKTGLIITLYWKKILLFNKLILFLRKLRFPLFFQFFNTDSSKAILLLWFLTITSSCCPYLYFGSAIMLVTYFVNFR